MLKVTVAGKVYEVDNDRMDNKEAKAVEVFTGKRFYVFREGLTESDIDSLTVLVWLARKRAGEADLALQDVVFDLNDFQMEDANDPTDKTVEGDPVPPTVPTTDAEAGNAPG